jgi:hypothetical protein
MLHSGDTSAAELFTKRRYERRNLHGTGNPPDIATSFRFVWLTGLTGPALALAMVRKAFRSIPEGPEIHDIT